MSERAGFELGAHPAQEVDDLRRLEATLHLDRLELVGFDAFLVLFDFDLGGGLAFGCGGAGGLHRVFFGGGLGVFGGARLLVGLFRVLLFFFVRLFALLGLGGCRFGGG